MDHEHTQSQESEQGLSRGSSKMTFYFGLVSGIAAISFIGFMLTFSMLRAGGTIGAKNTNTGKVAGTTVNTAAPTNTAPTVGAPTAAPTVVDVPIRDDDFIRGGENAKVTLVEYSDFQCPFCEQVVPTLQKVLETYGDDVRLIYRHFPLTSLHPLAQKAAEASECAAEQGKFWELHDKLFEMNASGTLSIENFKSAAGSLGLNQSQFDSCLDSGKYQSKVQNDTTQGTQYGVQGTPATFVNGTLVSGAVPYEQFASVIDAELAK
ncbi:MAG: DsbA family protein [Parcubacteria group bacterium]